MFQLPGCRCAHPGYTTTAANNRRGFPLMNLDAFEPSLVYTTYIAATPERIWEALTTPEFSRKYFFGFAVDAELKIGGAFLVRAPDGSVHINGEVIECEPARKLTVTWNVNWPGLVEKLGSTLVTYEIEPAGESVRLTLTEAHDRPLDDDILSGGRAGWPAIVSSLKSLLETGNALVIKMEPPRRMLDALKKLGIATPSLSWGLVHERCCSMPSAKLTPCGY